MGSRIARFAFERGGLLVLTALVVYAIAAPTHIVDSDNAEFTTLGAIGGGAHPSGYPLYLLWLRATAWIPGSSPAHTAALATVILSVAQLWLLLAAARAWGATALAAAAAVAIYAAGPFVFRMAIQAEVFALNGLVGAAVLWLAAERGPVRGRTRALLLGLVAGLGMSNHLTCTLLAPLGVWGVSRAWREDAGSKLVVAAAAIGGCVLGLLPYAYLFVTDENLLSWPAPHDAGELVTIFLRREYGATSIGVAGSANLDAIASLGSYAAFVGRSLVWLPPVIALAAIGARVARPANGGGRVGWIALAASWLLAGPVLTWVADAPAEGFGLFVVRRYQLLSLVLLVVPLAVGLDLIAARARGDRVVPARRAWHGGVVASVVFVLLAIASVGRVRAVQSPAAELSVRNMLGSLPVGAVVLGEGDELHTGTRYLQLVLGIRTDVTYLHLRGLPTSWYRERFREYGIPIETLKGPDAILDLARAILRTGRPVFVVSRKLPLLRVLPSYPHGFLLRVLPEGASPPTLDEVVELDRAIYAAFDLGYPMPGPDDELAMATHQRYASTWLLLARALRGAGRVQDAEAAEDIARQLWPH